MFLVDDRRSSTIEIIWQFIHFLDLSDVYLLIGKYRIIQDAPDAGLEESVDISEPQDIGIHLTEDIDIFDERDPILRQGSRLIRTEDVHASEIRDGIEPLDDSSLRRHLSGSFRHIDVHDHRKKLRSDSYRHCKREDDGLKDILMIERIDQKYHHNDEDDGFDDEISEFLDPCLEGRHRHRPDELFSYLAVFRIRSRSGDDIRRIPGDYSSSRKHQASIIRSIRHLLHREAFAGQ